MLRGQSAALLQRLQRVAVVPQPRRAAASQPGDDDAQPKKSSPAREELNRLFGPRPKATHPYAHEVGKAPPPVTTKNVHVGWQQFHVTDPRHFQSSFEWPDAHKLKTVFYRSIPNKPNDSSAYENTTLYWFSAFVWAFLFYRLYWSPDVITGEWYLPWVEDLTDEELGIPPEGSAGEPEYWGKHFSKEGIDRSTPWPVSGK